MDQREQPTNARYGILAFLGSMTFVLYIDRVCIGQAAEAMKQELGISNQHWGYVLASFTIAYGLFEVPAGRLGDRWGSRGVLTRIVIWWSAFTILTGLAVEFWMLLTVRFLFGAGEAGALPNAARVISRWFPESSRGSAQGVITTCMMVGGAFAPVAAAELIRLSGWRVTFMVFGLLGLVWSAAFWAWFRDEPSEHPSANEAERQLILEGRAAGPAAPPPIPWARVLSNPNVWLMGLLMTCNASVYYMLISWFSSYLQAARDVPALSAGRLTSMVLAGGAVGCLSGGRLLDQLILWTGNRRRSRSGLAFCSLTCGALAMTGGVWMDDPVYSAICVSLACFFLQLQIPAWWSTVTQISGRHLGAMFGLMNSLGVPGAAGSQVLLGKATFWLEDAGYSGRDCWDPAMYCYGGVMLFAACLWWCVNPERRIDVDIESEEGIPDGKL